jgi:exosortase
MTSENTGNTGAIGQSDRAVPHRADPDAVEYAGAQRRLRAAYAPTWWEYLGPSGAAKILVLAGLVALLYWGQLYRMVSLWQQPDWSHGFLIPVFALYILNTRRQELLTIERRGSMWGLPAVLLSLAVYTACTYLKIGYLPDLSLISTIAGLVLLVLGWRSLWLTIFPIGFLLLAIPPPDRLYRALTQPLQQGVAAVSTTLLNLFPGADVSREGFQIGFQMDSGLTGSFAVVGACSGMRSLMAFIALGLAMAYFTPRAMWQRIAMAVVVVPVAVFCNVLRVIITGGLQMYGYAHLAKGTTHTMLGFLAFGVGFAVYLLILYVLDHLMVEESPEEAAETAGGAK